MAGLFRKKERFVVATIMVALRGDEAKAARDALIRATRRIAESGRSFEVASTEVAAACEALVAAEGAWTHAAHWGEIYFDEESASSYADECFADAAGRYVSGGAGDGAKQADAEGEPGDHVVATLTVGYKGENARLETPADDVVALREALEEVVALHRRDALVVAQLHVVPGHPEDRLQDEQMLVSFPELVSL